MASPGFIAACCLGNQSIFIDKDIPPNHVLLQEKAVSGVSLTFAVLSILGLFIVLYPWRCARKQSPHRLSQHLQGPNLNHVVYCIIAAAVIGNIGNIFGMSIYIIQVIHYIYRLLVLHQNLAIDNFYGRLFISDLLSTGIYIFI